MPRANRRLSVSGALHSAAIPGKVTPGPAPAHRPKWHENPGILACIVAVVTLVSFCYLFGAEFCNWDDNATIIRNPRLNPPSIDNLLHMWDPRHPHMDLYAPVTYTVWSAMAKFAWVAEPDTNGVHLNPWFFHGVNVLLHVASATTAFALLRQLLRGRYREGQPAPGLHHRDLAAAAAALLYGIHPMQVEAVAWVSGTKDVLYGLFALLAVWQYAQYVERTVAPPGPLATFDARRWAHYGLGILCFALGMLSKPTALIVPFAAAVLDVFVMRRPGKVVLRDLLPWFLLVIPCVLEGRYAQPVVDSGFIKVPLNQRPLIAADALAFYAYKLVFPAWLGFPYGRSPPFFFGHPHWKYWTWLVPVVLATGIILSRRRWPWLMVGGMLFLIGVLPVLGFLPFDFQSFSTVTDHYVYFAMIGPALTGAFTLASLPAGSLRRFIWAATPVVLMVLAVRTFFQTFHWSDEVTLARRATRVNPDSSVNWAVFGRVSATAEHLDDSLFAYQQAARLDPDSAPNHSNLATALASVGRLEEADAEYHLALRMKPDLESAKLGLSILQYVRDVKKNPNMPVTLPFKLKPTEPGPRAIR